MAACREGQGVAVWTHVGTKLVRSYQVGSVGQVVRALQDWQFQSITEKADVFRS